MKNINTVLLLILILVATLIGTGIVKQKQTLTAELKRLEAENSRLVDRVARREEKIEYLSWREGTCKGYSVPPEMYKND